MEKMKKNIITAILAGCLVAAILAGCGGGGDPLPAGNNSELGENESGISDESQVNENTAIETKTEAEPDANPWYDPDKNYTVTVTPMPETMDFDYIGPMVNGLAFAGYYPDSNNPILEVGLINKDGELVIPIEYVYEWYMGRYDNYRMGDLIIVGKLSGSNQVIYGAINVDNEVVIPFGEMYALEYEELKKADPGIILPKKYDTDGDGILDLYGYENAADELVIEPKYTYAEGFSVELACVRDINGKYGLINRNGEFVVAPQYDEAHSLGDGVAIIGVNWYNEEGNHNPLGIRELGLISAVDGSIIIEPQYIEMYALGGLEEKLIRVAIDADGDPNNIYGKKYGYIDYAGKVVIPPEYDELGDFSYGLVAAKNGDFGEVFDKYGNTVIPLEYNTRFYAANGVILTYTNNMYGWIDKDGNELSPQIYNSVSDFSEHGFALVSVNDDYGIVDINGNVVVDFNYRLRISGGFYFSENMAFAEDYGNDNSWYRFEIVEVGG
jgi:hypothetical protein